MLLTSPTSTTRAFLDAAFGDEEGLAIGCHGCA
jgi:hypothetical protein